MSEDRDLETTTKSAQAKATIATYNCLLSYLSRMPGSTTPERRGPPILRLLPFLFPSSTTFFQLFKNMPFAQCACGGVNPHTVDSAGEEDSGRSYEGSL